MKMRIMYKRKQFAVEWEKPKNCEACGLVSPGKFGTNCHHYLYEFTTAQVRENPELIKKNTIWLCFPCHRVADAIRVRDDNYARALKIEEMIKCKKSET
jgi:hypothetical protein